MRRGALVQGNPVDFVQEFGSEDFAGNSTRSDGSVGQQDDAVAPSGRCVEVVEGGKYRFAICCERFEQRQHLELVAQVQFRERFV